MEHMQARYPMASANGHGTGEATLRQLLALSRRIAEIRERQGLSQQEVAERTHLAQQHVSRVERGMNCNMFTFLKVCRALGIQVTLTQARNAP